MFAQGEIDINQFTLVFVEQELVFLAYLVEKLDEQIGEELQALVIKVTTVASQRQKMGPNFVINLVI